MTFKALFLAAAMAFFALAQAETTEEMADSLRARIVGKGGCAARVCFALDGSGSINASEWRAQKDFVLLVSNIISVDPDSKFAAVQYGLRLRGISLLTDRINKFLIRVDRARLARARRTFIASGLAFCISQLRRAPNFPTKVVVLGDGRSNFGGDPRPIALNWLRERDSNAICAIGIGFGADTSALLRITNNPNRVLTEDQWDKVVRVTRRLVEDVCELPAEF